MPREMYDRFYLISVRLERVEVGAFPCRVLEIEELLLQADKCYVFATWSRTLRC